MRRFTASSTMKYNSQCFRGKVASGLREKVQMQANEAILVSPSWMNAYEHIPRSYALWLILQNMGRYQLPQDEAIEILSWASGLNHSRSLRVIKQGMAELWDRRDGILQLRRPVTLRRQAFNRNGCALKGFHHLPSDLLAERLSTLRALLSLPVMAAPKGNTPRAYTQACQGISRVTVTRRRGILRQRGMLVQKAIYERVPAPKRGQQRPRNLFRRHGKWYRRLSDWIEIRTSDKTESEKPSSLREEFFNRSGGIDSFSYWGRKVCRFQKILDYYAYIRNEKDPPQSAHEISRRLLRNLGTKRVVWMLDPETGRIDPDCWAKMLNKEHRRILHLYHNCLRKKHAKLASRRGLLSQRQERIMAS